MNIDEMQASIKMDRLIAEQVMGWTNVYQDGVNLKGTAPGSDDQTEHVPFYSTDIAAAWQAVEKCNLLKSFYVLYQDMKSGNWVIAEDFGYGDWGNITEADTAPLAICRAALKAKEKLNAT